MMWRLVIILLFLLANCKPVINEDYNGLNYLELVDKLGQPNGEFDLLLYKGVNLYEYQSSLYDIIDTTLVDTVLIKQLTWEKKLSTQVVWLKEQSGEYVSFDNLKWNITITL